MNNNDILRRIRYTFDYSDPQMIQIFALAEQEVSRNQICEWLKKEQEEGYQECNDTVLATFLNGLIIEKRGKRDAPLPEPEKKLTNNMKLTKLKIALNLKTEDMLDILTLAGVKVGKSELSAFFRKPNHKNYRKCLDQFLRNFLDGIILKYRDGLEPSKPFEWTKPEEQNKDQESL